MQNRLRELHAPIYGDKAVLWTRLVREEARVRREKEIADAYQAQREAEREGEGAEPAAQSPPIPQGPTRQEREAHELTHLPPAAWCEQCIMGRGPVAPHRVVDWHSRALGPALVQFDFGYMKSDGTQSKDAGDAWATTLFGADEQTGCILCVTVVTKEKANTYMHNSVTDWLDKCLRYKGRKIRVQTDGEPAIKSLVNFISVRRGEDSILSETIARTSPAYSSGSLGLAEACIRRGQNQMRVLRCCAEKRYQISLSPAHVTWPWLVRHAGWLLDRFSVRASGRTGFMQLTDSGYKGEIVLWLECVLWRIPMPSSRSLKGGARWQKADSAWKPGVWLGKETHSDEHVIGTEAGVISTRTIRRLPLDRQRQLMLVERMKGTPWDRKEGVAPGHNMPRGPFGPQPATPAPPDGGPDGGPYAEEERQTAPAESAPAESTTPATYPGAEVQPVAGQASSSAAGGPVTTSSTAPAIAPPSPRQGSPAKRDRDPLGAPGKRDTREGEGDVQPSRRPPPFPAGRPTGTEAVVATGGEAVLRAAAEEQREAKREDKTRKVAGLAVVDEEMRVEDLNADWSDVWPEEVEDAKWKEIGEQDKYETYDPILRADARRMGCKHISTKWHGTRDSNGNVKMRFVAREFNPGTGKDKGDYFAVTSSSNHGRLIDSDAIEFAQVSWVFDCSRAFLHVKETELVSVEPPAEWLEWHRANGRYLEDYVWRMRKTLYGRRAAPQGWTLWLASLLRDAAGLSQHDGVPSFFKKADGKLVVEIHMDEGHGSSTREEFADFKRVMEPLVAIKFAGPFTAGDKYAFLGVSRERFAHATVLRPDGKYARTVVKLLGLEKAKPAATPCLDLNVQPEDMVPVDASDHSLFRSVVGCGLYLSRFRPDLLYGVKELGRWLAQPVVGMWPSLKRLGRYLVDKNDYAIVLRRGVRDKDGLLPMPGVSDTNWASCKRSRKSTGCFHISVGLQCPIMTLAKTQTVVADSSGLAEWYGGVSCAAELLFTVALARWIGLPVRPSLHLDSSAAIGMAKRIGSGKLRTLETKTLWLQQHLAGGALADPDIPLKIYKIDGTYNVADIGTKNLAADRLYFLCRMTGMEKLAPGDVPPLRGVDCVPWPEHLG